MTDPRSKPRHSPVQRDGQHPDRVPAVPAPVDPPVRQPEQQAAVDKGLRWPWLLSDHGILTVACLVACLGILGLTIMWLIANRLHGADRANLQIGAIKYGLGFIAGGGAAAALLLSVRRQQLSEQSHQLEIRKQDLDLRKHEQLRELELRKQQHAETNAAEQRVTELYTKAVEQLGSTDAAVRLGGLYALERVAQNNTDQRQTIVNVICAYLRMPYTPPGKPQRAQQHDTNPTDTPANTDADVQSGRDPRQELQVRLTAQRILAAHLRRPDGAPTADFAELEASPSQQFWPRIDLDLTGATLIDWKFDNAAVRGARFYNATFTGDADFWEASFSENALFGRATFTESALFAGAAFSGSAGFNEATFAEYAVFDEATFTGDAWFDEATFSGNAEFDGATFTGNAEFGKAIFTGNADFNETIFTGNAVFDQATHPNGPGAIGLGNCRVANRKDRRDRWLDGWFVIPGPEYSSLHYQPADAQPSTGQVLDSGRPLGARSRKPNR
ncbi:pentapeptide repeat-containing protein [Plantactinospora sp. CA-294935]|uniref:pentapeptide repeat-containing protein n=1 Tax=Plantactinospora sp. CA-294935 TaxID=3240012 RepID=UPI003D9031D3